MTDDPTAVIHHSVHGTHWLHADRFREAVREREPSLDLTVARTRSETADAIRSAEILLSSYVEPSLLESADRLRWIQALSAGVDSLPVDALREREIRLTNAAGAHAQPIAEQVLGYMLAFERRLDRAFEMRRRGVWERFSGGELAGKTLGIVGLGSIGQRTAELAAAVGMDVVGTKRDPDVDLPAVDRVYPSDDLEPVLVEADYLLLSCPLTEQTRGLVDRERLGVLPDDAVVINVARGPIVDEEALIEALQQRAIRGAALDVFASEPLPADSPLWDLSTVVVTPHNAGSSPAVRDRIADIFVDNYEAFVADEPDRLRNRIL